MTAPSFAGAILTGGSSTRMGRDKALLEIGGRALAGRVADALRGGGYDGWIVVEQDVFPGYGTPKASAQKSRDYLRRLGL